MQKRRQRETERQNRKEIAGKRKRQSYRQMEETATAVQRGRTLQRWRKRHVEAGNAKVPRRSPGNLVERRKTCWRRR